MHCLVLQLLATPFYQCSAHGRGLLAATSKGPWWCSFSGEVLGRHSVAGLCSFEKRTILPHLKHQPAPYTRTCQITWPGRPLPVALPCRVLSLKGIRMLPRAEIIIRALSLGRLLSGNQMGRCWVVSLPHKEATPFSLGIQPSFPSGKGKKCLPPPTDYLDLPSQVPLALPY